MGWCDQHPYIILHNEETGTRETEILSRNNPHEYVYEEYGEKPATVLCALCYCEGGYGFLCEECDRTHRCGEEMLLDVCNSPRMGVCGYCGSERYPDQFMSDTEMDA